MRSLRWSVPVLAMLSACEAQNTDVCPSPAACDIREPSCQAHAAALAACARGDEPGGLSVPVDVVDASTVRRSSFARFRAGDGAQDAATRAFELLGLVTPDARADRDLTRGRISDAWDAWYDAETRRITVRDRGRPMNSSAMLSTLVHEMTHAIQDELGGFESLQEAESGDTFLARLAVLEGDATLSAARTELALAQSSEELVNWPAYFANAQSLQQTRARDSRNLLEDARILFPYAWGLAYVHGVHARGGYAAVNDLFADDAPSDTATIVGLRTAGADLDAHAVPVLDATLTNVIHLGSWIARVYLDRFSHTDRPVLRDALSVFARARENGDGFDTTAYWRLEFANEREAQEVALALGGSEDGLRRVFVLDDEVVLAVSDGQSPAEPAEWREHGRADSYGGAEER